MLSGKRPTFPVELEIQSLVIDFVEFEVRGNAVLSFVMPQFLPSGENVAIMPVQERNWRRF
jgi:hypothetical protein